MYPPYRGENHFIKLKIEIMTKQLLNLTGILAFGLILLFTACDKNDLASPDSVDAYTEKAVFELQERSNCGRMGCFELVFPITIEFSDGTSSVVNDYEELKATIRSWKENNPDATERPDFVFPIEVISKDGEMVTVNSQEELHELRIECRGRFGDGPKGHRLFTFVFPGGDTLEVNNRFELQSSVRQWKYDNPNTEGRPQFVFPIDVELADGTVVTANSKEELKALKEDCRNG
jgi:hypothetical protein